MSLCLLTIQDGRGHLDAALESAELYLPRWDEQVNVDDSDRRLGFDGAVREGWKHVKATGCDYVFHLEEDFVITERLPVGQACDLLGKLRWLAQISFRRQPVNSREKLAGGILQADPDDFLPLPIDWPSEWVMTHRRYFTTNPSVYPASICSHGWPEGPESEGHFTHKLIERGYVFAVWGARDDPPMVLHVGERRGHGY